MYGYDSRVRLSEVDQNRYMTLNAILNHFQDCSSFHSEDLGVGTVFLEERNRTWVLSSWKIVILRYPELGEQIRVETWPYEFSKLSGRRNFRMLDSKGEMIACADSLWVYMDTVRRRPCRLEADVAGAYTMEPKLEGMEPEDDHIAIPEEGTAQEPFPIHRWHLDVNHHVNNGQYVQMAAEYLPEGFIIRQMRAEYKKSALLGDMIYPTVRMDRNGGTVVLGDQDGKPYAVIEFR